MLRWAYGYLAMAVVVAIGFAVVQGTHRAERRVVTPATEHDATSAPSVGTDEAELESESQPEDDSEYQDESDLGDDSQYQDESDPGDYGFRTRVSWKTTALPEDPGEWENEGEWEDEGSLEHESNLEYVVQPGAGGHYVVEAVVNGAPVTFLVDTGASDIVLTMADARAPGLPARHPALHAAFRDRERRGARCAGGSARDPGRPVQPVRRAGLGQRGAAPDLAAGHELPRQLDGYDVEDGRLILRW